MKIEHQFGVQRPIDQVWQFFQDVPSVAQCLPGAELTEDRGNGVFAGTVSVRLGPMTASFEGEATVTPDPETHSADIAGKGVDRRGGSRGQVKVHYGLSTTDAGTSVELVADVMLSGAAAQFGRTGLISEMSKRLIGEFVECLHGKLEAGSVEEASQIRAGDVKGFSLLIEVIAAWFRRLLGRR